MPVGISVPCGNKLIPVGENGLTGGTGEEAITSHVLDENPTHFHQQIFSCRLDHTFLGTEGTLPDGQLFCKERGIYS